MRLSVISDAVAAAEHDLLAFDRYVGPLVDILTDAATETPFTVGVFGEWGGGKSTLLHMLDERLETDHPDEFVRVHFNPWVYRREDGMLIPLLHTLHDTLMEDPGNRFVEVARTVLGVLTRLSADVILRKLTADAVSLEKIDKLKDDYVKQRGLVQSETRNLRRTLQKQADAIARAGAKLIIFVDDLDRCQPAEIIDVLELTKLFFDLRHTVIVLAVDKEVIDRGIEIKYSQFSFAKGREASIGAEYLEKMVQLPLQLFPLRETRVRTFVEQLGPPDVVRDQLDLLQTLLLPNPRKIKRIINVLAVTAAIADATPGLDRLDRGLLTRLVVLQVQSPDLYAQVVRQPDLLMALESVFRGTRRVQVLGDFSGAFHTRAGAIQELSQEYYRPDTYLAALFAGSAFEDHTDDLAAYVTMLER